MGVEMNESDSTRNERRALLRGAYQPYGPWNPGSKNMVALNAELDATEWRSVEDELPEVNVRVLACYLNPDFKRSGPTGFVTTRLQSLHWDTSSIVSHWMPLPGPPEQTK